MITVHVVAVGRSRDADLRATGERYLKRIRRYHPVQLVEVPDVKGVRDKGERRRREAERLEARTPAGARRVALTRTGKAISSRGLARRLQRWRTGARDVVVHVGGAFGLADTILNRADERLSLSPLTLPHELARLVLLEQLYRANSILRGEPYHKGD